MDHVHPTGELELAGAVWHQLNGRLGERRQWAVDGEVGQDDARAALPAFLAVEDDAKRHPLAHAHQVRRVAAAHGHPDLLDIADEFGGAGPARTEKEPGERAAQHNSAHDDDEILNRHGLVASLPFVISITLDLRRPLRGYRTHRP